MSFTPNFLAALENKNFRSNLVIDIDGTLFSKYQPESGLTIDADKVGLLDNASINGVTLDVRRANTPIDTISFDLLDKNQLISSFLGASPRSLQYSEVKLYLGFMTGSFGWSDYAILGTTRINGITKEANGYKFRSKEVTGLLQVELLNTFSTLDSGINAVATSVDLDDAEDFPNSGIIKVNNEFMTYTTKTGNTLSGLVRGHILSTAATHDQGDTVSLVTEKQAHVMDMALDIILNDLAIPASLVDTQSFIDIRDGDLDGEPDVIHYIYDVTNAIKFIEERVLEESNTRIFTVNGKITAGRLDQSPLVGDVAEIDETSTTNTPSWSLTSDKIANVIEVSWGWSEGLRKFTRLTLAEDEESIAIYGRRRPLEIKLYGVQSPVVAQNRANILLARFSTPTASIKVSTHLDKLGINVADNVRLTHRHIPQQGGSLGFSGILEVISKSVTGLADRASINFSLEFTSYSGIRIGLISPSPALSLPIIDQRTFTVPDGDCYKEGYGLVLFDNVNNVYFSDSVNYIESIDGNVITMQNNFITPLGPNVSLYFADYDQSSAEQKAQYAYIAPDTGLFVSDNSKAYQIIF